MKSPFITTTLLAMAILSIIAVTITSTRQESIADPANNDESSQNQELEGPRGPKYDYEAPGALGSLKPEDRKKWEKIWAAYLSDTLELRKKINNKKIELETLWAQEKIDRARIEILASELADLKAIQTKACDKYLLDVRTQFGKRGWTCPIGNPVHLEEGSPWRP